MIYRRFGYLHSRIILRKQDELRQLEDDLDRIDIYDIKDNTPQARSRLRSRAVDEAADSYEDPGTRTRTEILNEIDEKLRQYGEATIC